MGPRLENNTDTINQLVKAISSGCLQSMHQLDALCADPSRAKEIFTCLKSLPLRENPVALYYLAVLTQHLTEKANLFFKAAILCKEKDMQLLVDPIRALHELADKVSASTQAMFNLYQCYQKGIKVPQNIETANYYLYQLTKHIFQNVLLNRMSVDTNLFGVLKELEGKYYLVIQNHLELLKSKKIEAENIEAIIAILESVKTIGIMGLLAQGKSLEENLSNSKLQAAIHLSEFLNQYRMIEEGIKKIDERTKQFLLILKKELPKKKFKIVSYSMTGQKKFVEGRPNGVRFTEDKLKALTINSSSSEFRLISLAIRDELENKKYSADRDGGTTTFYNEVVLGLYNCWLFTPVSEANSAIKQHNPSACVEIPVSPLPGVTSQFISESPSSPHSPEHKRQKGDEGSIPPLTLNESKPPRPSVSGLFGTQPGFTPGSVKVLSLKRSC